MQATIKGKAKAVIRAYDAFLKEPTHSLPYLFDKIEELRRFIEAKEKEEQDKEPRLFK